MGERVVDTISIIGVGLIGGSIGMAAKARGLARKVIGIGRDARKLHRAQELAAVDAYTTDLLAGVREADIVFICTPVLAIVPTIKAIAPVLKEGAIVTDVGSTKAEITRGADEALPEGRFFVGGHPMAGSEADGVEAALPYLFLNATYVITPTSSTDVMALNTLVRFAEGLGSNVILMDPEQHDRSVAIISHVPHVLASAILRLAAEEQAKSGQVLELAAGSFRDMTRVASSPPEIWVDICLSSKEAISSALKKLEDLLTEVRMGIESGDAKVVKRHFSEGKMIRDSWAKDFPDDSETE
ncbi:MAG TPA: prephenate dehydrogenase/arogenate dehydrogenase family protein [Armatimonadota bacterium]|jgi:prephenate dehydrogenase|nr:prephenate dehydrogenase/arogenate dehydrogenase family protein [Armatimonadota bacterium]